VRYDPYRGR